jgi:hypothetical protein
MSARTSIDAVSAKVASAVTLTEGRFLAMGKNLESAMGILARLIATFGQLQADLESEGLRNAVDDLSRVAAQVQDIAGVDGRRNDVFTRLTDLTDGIGGRVARMRQAVRGVSMLAVNARIAAAGLSAAGAEFMEFSTEIARSLRLAGDNLEHLGHELAELGSQVRAASAGSSEFERLQAGAGKTIPRRLTVGVQTVATRRSEAAASSSSIAARSQQTQARIGSAVMALQIGDSTRQRAEHVQQSLAMAADALAAAGDRQGSTDRQRRALAAKVCTLAAAQLTDAADEFAREAARILAALAGLARDAREIAHLGDAAFGAAAGRGSFLQELDGEIGEARQLLDGFQAARAAADRLAGSVAAGSANLAAQIKTLRSLEADIRILALNTALKCGRIGAEGRSLEVVARELREFSAGTEREAVAVAEDLDRVVAVARTLDEGAAVKSVNAASVTEAMTTAAAQLGACERGFTTALAMLTRDGAAIAALLEETASSISAGDDIGALLRQAAADLAGLQDGADAADVAEAGGAVFASIYALYTMAQEREVHARVIGAAPADAGAGTAAPAADAGLDDILF